MKKTILTLVLVLVTFCTFSAMAAGRLRSGGKSLVEAGRIDELNYYLNDICGASTLDSKGYITSDKEPTNKVGDVYYVEVNDYWVGSDGSAFNYYDEINMGVTKIDKVSEDCKQQTTSGTFYTYEAKNANKFFFIVRASKCKDYNKRAFAWYDEWSYVKNYTKDRYAALKAKWDELKDGYPFSAPHNCSSSLENNHYITLNEKEDDESQHYNFTAYLYIPSGATGEGFQGTYAVPYVFFYNVKLNEGELERKPSTSSEYECPYNVDLDWNTAFDIFAKEKVEMNTKYDTMKEHFVIQRSYDKTNWEDLGAAVDVNGNDVKVATGKITTDTGLKDFDETTKEIGYTVYYRVISYVQKDDDTQMSTTTSNVVSVDVPGTTPFSLKLGPNGTSQYNPGNMVGDKYDDGSNTFTNKLVAAMPKEYNVEVRNGSKISLVRTDAENESGVEVKSYTVDDATMSLKNLVAEIGEYTDEFTTQAGEAKDATYQLVLKEASGAVTRSNLATIANAKVNGTVVASYRSGTPDAKTCAEVELFHNEITFTPAGTGINTGYYIYRDGEKIAQLVDNGNGTFSRYGETEETALVDGKLTVADDVEASPIAVGENAGETKSAAEWNYAVVHYDGNKNTYGSKAEAADFAGALGELVVNAEGAVKTGYSYVQIVSATSLNWTNNARIGDMKVKEYKIFRSVEDEDDGAYKEVGNTTDMTYTDSYVYNRKPQTSGNWVNKPSADEYKKINYYVKAIVETAETAKNAVEKNSGVVMVDAAQGSIFTAVEGVSAESVTIAAVGGVITVTGATGLIEVYNASGMLVAKANGNGGVTDIDATALSAGAYVVKVLNANSKIILIK